MNSEEQLHQAGALIKQKRYEEARDILEDIADNPTAQKWLTKLDEVAPKAKRKFEDDYDDPFGGIGDDYPREREKAKLGGLPYSSTQGDPNQAPHKDYTGISILIFFLYWLLWVPGIAANLYYLNDAREYQKYWGKKPNGVGCLWAILLFNILPVLACCGLIFSLAAIGPEVEEIIEDAISTLSVHINATTIN